MIIAAPREMKPGERRVGIDPAWANDLVGKGHAVLVEKSAGHFSGS